MKRHDLAGLEQIRQGLQIGRMGFEGPTRHPATLVREIQGPCQSITWKKRAVEPPTST